MSSTHPVSAILEQVTAVVDGVRAPVNVLALASGPSVGDLEAAGVRRVSTGSSLARTAYGALLAGAHELQSTGTSHYAGAGATQDALAAAFDAS